MPLQVHSQTALAAATETTIVDGTQQTGLVVKSLVVCNRSGASDNVRLRLRRTGAAVDDKQYLLYEVGVNGNTSANLVELYTGEIGLRPGDILTAYAGSANLSFTVMVNEV